MISSVTEAETAAVGLARQGSYASDEQILAIWLHGRSVHTQRAYRADIERFLARAGKPLPAVTLADLQQFADSLSSL